MSKPASLPLAGETFDGQYRIVRKIGAGGMGVVYEALGSRPSRRVAIKLMHPSVIPEKNAVERFLREARAASRLVSAHVAKVYGAALTGDEIPYLVMELLDGHDLAHELKRKTAMPVRRAVRILEQ